MNFQHLAIFPFVLGLGLSGCNCGDDGARDAGEDAGHDAGQDGGHGAIAIDVTGLGAAGFNYTQGTYITGFVFRAKSPLKVTELGYYDSNLTGKTETFETHDVGVYDLSTNALLAQATVAPSDPVLGLFHYATLDGGLALGTSDTYAIVGVTGTNYYTVGIQQSEAPVNPALTYVSGAGYSTTADNNNPTMTSTLVQPNAFDNGNIFGQTPDAGTLSDFGPDFLFVPGS